MNKKIVVLHITHFPPPFAGTQSFNKRVFDFLKEKQINFKSLNLSSKIFYDNRIINIKFKTVKNILEVILKPLFLYKLKKNIKKKYFLEVPINRLLKDSIKANAIRKVLDYKCEYSVLCDHLGKNELVFAILKEFGYKIRINTYLHGSGILERYDTNPEYYKRYTNLTDTFIVGSNYMKKIYLDKKDRVNDVRICPPTLLPDNYYEFYEDKRNSIVFVGTLNWKKNPMFILEEIKNFKEILGKYQFTFIGNGPLLNEMIEFVKKYKLENITFLGEITNTEVEEFLKRSKYLIQPSKVETFGIAIVEAMAKGTVPIVSDAGGMKEIFTEKAGYVFKNEPGELVKVFKEIISDNNNFEAKSMNAFKESLAYRSEVTGKKLINILLEE